MLEMVKKGDEDTALKLVKRDLQLEALEAPDRQKAETQDESNTLGTKEGKIQLIDPRFKTPHMRDYEFTFILKEFESKERHNNSILLKVMRRLLFFKRFQSAQHQEIIDNAKIKIKRGNEVLYRTGEFDDSMYVILRGAVQIRKMGMN